MKISLLSLLFTVLTSNVYAIYDEDNRRDPYKENDEKLVEISQAVAHQIYKDELRGWTFQRYWQVVTRPLENHGVCSNERFSEQPTMRDDCSGVLIGPKLLLTAGNCTTAHYCKNDLFYWMFDYKMDEGGFDHKRHRQNFYKCERIVQRIFDPSTAISYIVLELEKEVVGVKPVKLSKTNTLSSDDELVVMGHPEGLPLKIAAGARVFDQNEKHFLVSSDIHGSNKGAPIINKRTYELEGILISGRKNYEFSPSGCERTPVFSEVEAKELALKVSQIGE